MYVVVLEREDCTSCGHCVEVDESLFTFDDDDRATIIGAEREDDVDELEIEDRSMYEEAVDKCTGQCIEIYDE